MDTIQPIEHSRPLPAVERIKRDRGKGGEPPPRPREEDRPPDDEPPTPHIDEYA